MSGCVTVLVELPTYEVVEVEGAALKTFRCEPHEATVTVSGCAARFEKAQTAHRRRNGQVNLAAGAKTGGASADALEARADAKLSMDACGRCPIGAAHAGVTLITHSAHFGSDQCPRCGFGTNRMIAGRVCVNCYNREREFLSGRNGRGNLPKRLAAIHGFTLRLVVDHGQPVAFSDTGVSPIEVMLRQLRTTKGTVAFAPRRPYLGAQMRLFG